MRAAQVGSSALYPPHMNSLVSCLSMIHDLHQTLFPPLHGNALIIFVFCTESEAHSTDIPPAAPLDIGHNPHSGVYKRGPLAGEQSPLWSRLGYQQGYDHAARDDATGHLPPRFAHGNRCDRCIEDTISAACRMMFRTTASGHACGSDS